MQLAAEQINRLTEQLTRACGPMLEALRLSDIEDLALNPDGTLWQKRRSEGWTPIASMDEDAAYEIVTSVAAGVLHAPVRKRARASNR